MIITKTVGHQIHMGPYETVTLSATAELEVPEGARRDKALDEIDELLKSALEDDIKEARRLADDDSYIRDWKV